MSWALLLPSKIEFAALPLVSYKLEVKKVLLQIRAVHPIFFISHWEKQIPCQGDTFRIFIGFPVWPSLSLWTCFFWVQNIVYLDMLHISPNSHEIFAGLFEHKRYFWQTQVTALSFKHKNRVANTYIWVVHTQSCSPPSRGSFYTSCWPEVMKHGGLPTAAK